MDTSTDRQDRNGSLRVRGSLTGMLIGDALAMPVHWYYDRGALKKDYGRVTDYLTPLPHHPDSILWRSAYRAPNSRGEILHDQARYWGRRNVHYHQFLRAGENTLNIQIARLLMDSLAENGGYRRNDFLRRYIAFMTTPGQHRDTYIEECHRKFFFRYAQGVAPEECGVEEKHIGGLIGIVPAVAFFHNRPELARKTALAHLALTHRGNRMQNAGNLFVDLLLALLGGASIGAVIEDQLAAQRNSLLGHPFSNWLDDEDETVVGRRFSTACYVEDAFPAVVYLALKYRDDPEAALIANTNLGGDNAGRGAVLGALMGAAHGLEGFPERWIRKLASPPPDVFFESISEAGFPAFDEALTDIADIIEKRIGDIGRLPEAAQSRIRSVYRRFFSAYQQVCRIAPKAKAYCRTDHEVLDPEILEYMKHFFSDYQHIWREFEEVDRAALALMNTDDLQLPMEYDRRINALLRGGGKSPGDDVWAAVLEDSESRRS